MVASCHICTVFFTKQLLSCVLNMFSCASPSLKENKTNTVEGEMWVLLCLLKSFRLIIF